MLLLRGWLSGGKVWLLSKDRAWLHCWLGSVWERFTMLLHGRMGGAGAQLHNILVGVACRHNMATLYVYTNTHINIEHLLVLTR